MPERCRIVWLCVEKLFVVGGSSGLASGTLVRQPSGFRNVMHGCRTGHRSTNAVWAAPLAKCLRWASTLFGQMRHNRRHPISPTGLRPPPFVPVVETNNALPSQHTKQPTSGSGATSTETPRSSRSPSATSDSLRLPAPGAMTSRSWTSSARPVQHGPVYLLDRRGLCAASSSLRLRFCAMSNTFEAQLQAFVEPALGTELPAKSLRWPPTRLLRLPTPLLREAHDRHGPSTLARAPVRGGADIVGG